MDEEMQFYPVATLGFRSWHYYHGDEGSSGELTSLFPHSTRRNLNICGNDVAPEFRRYRAGYYVWDLDGVNKAGCSLRPYDTDTIEPHKGKIPPVSGCSCGFYAMHTRLQEQRTCVLKEGRQTLSPYGVVSGVIAIWGEVDQWLKGCKAEKAYILGLFEPSPFDALRKPYTQEVVEILAKSHGIPLLRHDSLFDPDEVAIYAAEHNVVLAQEVIG